MDLILISLGNLWLSGYYGGNIMQKNMFKALGVFTLALFVMSMTGAAATTTCTISKAKADIFHFSPSIHSGNVLKNDVGNGLKVVKMSSCTNGGKVTMKSNGIFSYTRSSCSLTTTTVKDSFTYTIKNKCGQTSTARVTVYYKCH
jgi:hypothetical protein